MIQCISHSHPHSLRSLVGQGILRTGMTGCRVTSTTSSSSFVPSTPSITEVLNAKISRYLAWYDEVTGLRNVLWAQNRVLELEQQVLLSQSERREVSRNLDSLRTKIRDLNSELENTTRGDDKYVQIITQEHRLLKEEKSLTEQLKFIENGERDLFSALSSAVRESHEKERARAERTKYWSIIGTLIGSALGVIGTSVNNWFKMRELKKILIDTVHLRDELKEDVADIVKSSLPARSDPPLMNELQGLFEKYHVEPVSFVNVSPNLDKIILDEILSTKFLIISGFVVSAFIYLFSKY